MEWKLGRMNEVARTKRGEWRSHLSLLYSSFFLVGTLFIRLADTMRSFRSFWSNMNKINVENVELLFHEFVFTFKTRLKLIVKMNPMKWILGRMSEVARAKRGGWRSHLSLLYSSFFLVGALFIRLADTMRSFRSLREVFWLRRRRSWAGIFVVGAGVVRLGIGFLPTLLVRPAARIGQTTHSLGHKNICR